MKKLHDLETHEVSFVPKGANGKQFLVFKNLKGKQGMANAKEILDWVNKGSDPVKMKEVEKVIKDMTDEMAAQKEKPVSDKAQAAMQAIARIASPMKDEIHPGHLVKILQAAGYDMKKAMEMFGNPDGSVHNPDGEPPATLHDSSAPLEKDFQAIPEEILSDMKDVLKEKMEKGEDWGKHKGSDEDDDEDDDGDEDEADGGDDMDKAIKGHMMDAMKSADCAYKEHMAKLGYRKYPDAEVRMKSVRKDPKQVDVSDENHAGGEAQPMDKNVMKSLDLSKVDPKVKNALELVFKANEVAVAKAAKLEGELRTEREARRTKEFVEKAAGISVGAKTEDVAEILKAVADISPEKAAKLESILKGAGEAIKKGDLFKELGSKHEGGGAGGDDPWSKIQTIASGMVEKSAGKIDKAGAIEAVLKTEEGKSLYSQYMALKPGMKV